MTTIKKILFFVVLPLLAPLILPPRLLQPGGGPILFLGLLFGISALLLSPFLWRGRTTALTLAIFLQGLNAVIRLMTFYPNLAKQGVYDIPWLITSLVSLALSVYLILRLDRTDVRVTMIS